MGLSTSCYSLLQCHICSATFCFCHLHRFLGSKGPVYFRDTVFGLFLCGRHVCSILGIYFALGRDIRRCASQPPVEVGRRGKGRHAPSLLAQRPARSNPREASVSCSTFVRSLPVPKRFV